MDKIVEVFLEFFVAGASFVAGVIGFLLPIAITVISIVVFFGLLHFALDEIEYRKRKRDQELNEKQMRDEAAKELVAVKLKKKKRKK